MCEVPFFKPLPLPGPSSHTVSVSVQCLFALLARVVQPSFPDKPLEAGLHLAGVHLVPNIISDSNTAWASSAGHVVSDP